MTHSVDRALEDRHVRPEADRDHGRVVADDPATDHEHASRRDAGDTAEQKPSPAERLLQEVGACLGGEASGDLAHRCEERQSPIVGFDGLVGDTRGAALDEGTRQLLASRQVQVGEEHETVAE